MKSLLSLLVCLTFGPWTWAAEKVTLRLGYEDNAVFPFFIGDGEEIPALPGATVELIQRLPKKISHLQVALQRMPWKRCLVKLQKGEIDVVVASFKPERMENGVYPMKDGLPNSSLRIGNTSYALYKLQDSSLSWDGQVLRGLTGAVGVPRGYSIGSDLQALGATVDESGSTGADLEKLLMLRLSAVAAVETVGDFYLKQPKYKTIVKVSPSFAPKDYYLLLSHQFVAKNPQLSDQIWRAIAVIREKEMNGILAKYLK